MRKVLTAIINPLRSRKVRTAFTTALFAYLSTYLPNLTEERLYAIVGVITTLGVAVIGGTAIEDAGHKVGLPPTNGGTETE